MQDSFKLTDIKIVPKLSAETTVAIENAMRNKSFPDVTLGPIDLTQFTIVVNNVYVYDKMIRVSIMMNGREVSVYSYSNEYQCRVYRCAMEVTTSSGDAAVTRLNAILIKTQAEQFFEIIEDNWTNSNVTWTLYVDIYKEIMFFLCCGMKLRHTKKIWDDSRPNMSVSII